MSEFLNVSDLLQFGKFTEKFIFFDSLKPIKKSFLNKFQVQVKLSLFHHNFNYRRTLPYALMHISPSPHQIECCKCRSILLLCLFKQHIGLHSHCISTTLLFRQVGALCKGDVEFLLPSGLRWARSCCTMKVTYLNCFVVGGDFQFSYSLLFY